MRQVTILLATAAVAIGMVALGRALWNRSAQFLANSWRERLERVPEDQVDDLLDRLAELDEAGLPALADALASGRACVAQGAARVLRSQPKRWQRLEAHEATRRRRILAKALADGWPHYGPAARDVATETVAILLSRAPPEGGLGDAEFLAACEEVLRPGTSPGGVGLQESTNARAGRWPAPNSAVASRGQDENHPPRDLSTEHGETLAQAASPAPGTFPLEPAPMPQGTGGPLKATKPSAREPLDKGATPRASDEAGASGALRGAGPAESASEMPDDGSVSAKGGTANGPRRLSTVRAVGFEGRRRSADEPGNTLRSASELRQVARRLHDQDPRQVEAASKELKRCGFSDAELELARQLTHPDAGVRKSLARALPGTAGIDAAPWLLELSRDPDADVRLEAITLLATTGDPALLEQLRRLVQADTDERVQRLSDRLARPTAVAEKKAATSGGVRK